MTSLATMVDIMEAVLEDLHPKGNWKDFAKTVESNFKGGPYSLDEWKDKEPWDLFVEFLELCDGNDHEEAYLGRELFKTPSFMPPYVSFHSFKNGSMYFTSHSAAYRKESLVVQVEPDSHTELGAIESLAGLVRSDSIKNLAVWVNGKLDYKTPYMEPEELNND